MNDAVKPAPKAKAEVQTVVMSDGRSVDFVGKRKMLKEVLIDGTSVKVRFDFRNGETRLWTIPDAQLLQCAGHGGSQKVGDEAAGEDDVDDMILAVDAVIERLDAGDWYAKRESGGMAGTSVLLKALVELTKKSVAEVKAFLKDKTQAEKMALRASTQLKPIVERLEAEKASKASPVDTEALLAQIGGATPA